MTNPVDTADEHARHSHSTRRRRGCSVEPCLFLYRVVEVVEVLEDADDVVISEDYSRNQLINLDRGPHSGRGRFVRLKARIERTEGQGSLRGRIVHWRFAPSGAERSNLSDGFYDRLPRRLISPLVYCSTTARTMPRATGWRAPGFGMWAGRGTM